MSEIKIIMDTICMVILLYMWFITNMRIDKLKEKVDYMEIDIKDLKMELEQYERD